MIMKTEKLIHLIYASAATYPCSSEALLNLLSQARLKNRELNITGILLYVESNFFQVLEGNQKAVDSLFATISADNRHHNVVKIIYETIHARSFKYWEMGFANVTLSQLQTIEGLNDFFHAGTLLTELDAGRSKKLLEAFSKGYWRQAITSAKQSEIMS